MALNNLRNPSNAFNENGEKVRGENYFAMVPLTMLGARMNGATWDVYVALDGMQGTKEKCWPSIKHISKITNQSETSVKRAIQNLESQRFLKVTRRRGKGNYYFVINGARRSGQEIEPTRQEMQKKTRKNNLKTNGSSKRDSHESS